MILDKLYTIAFKFRKKKVWNNVLDIHVFAIKFSDGNIGYINITHSTNGNYSLGLYMGDKGFNSLRTITDLDKLLVAPFSPFKFQEMLLQQECLKCIFVGKDQLLKEELESIHQYTGNHNIRLGGKNAYPQFIKYIPNCIPVITLNEKEQEYLYEAFSASIALADILDGQAATSLGMTRIFDDTDEILSMEFKDGNYIFGRIPYPEKNSITYPSPEANNDIAVAKLKRAKKIGIWECELIRFPRPIQNNPEEIPFYPVFLMAVENSTDYFLPISPVSYYEESPEKLIDFFMDSLLEQNICPAEIRVRDQRTYSFAENLCQKLKIPLIMENNLESLEEAEFAFWDRFGMIDENEEEAKPVNFKNKITSIAPTQSFIISISPGTGCYRHIQISGNSTLFELHSFILKIFDIEDNKSQHAFFMDNKLWSRYNCYFSDVSDSDNISTFECKLNQTGLCKGKQFKYLFDFNFEHKFQCKVLQVKEEDTDKPILLNGKG